MLRQPEPLPLTQLLQLAHAGDSGAADRAYQALHPELLKIARARLRVHQAPTLLDTRALVHESFLRVVKGAQVDLQSRKHFYAYAAKAMRHIVIDFVRRTQAQRRGGDLQEVTFDTALIQDLPASPDSGAPVADVDDALQALERRDPQPAELVELRFYGGCALAQQPWRDPLQVAPAHYIVRFENERVRVLEGVDQPGERIAMLDHPDILMVVLSSIKRKLVLANGREILTKSKPGDVRRMPAQAHAGENIGSTETRALFIEFKPTVKPEPP